MSSRKGPGGPEVPPTGVVSPVEKRDHPRQSADAKLQSSSFETSRAEMSLPSPRSSFDLEKTEFTPRFGGISPPRTTGISPVNIRFGVDVPSDSVHSAPVADSTFDPVSDRTNFISFDFIKSVDDILHLSPDDIRFYSDPYNSEAAPLLEARLDDHYRRQEDPFHDPSRPSRLIKSYDLGLYIARKQEEFLTPSLFDEPSDLEEEESFLVWHSRTRPPSSQITETDLLLADELSPRFPDPLKARRSAWISLAKELEFKRKFFRPSPKHLRRQAEKLQPNPHFTLNGAVPPRELFFQLLEKRQLQRSVSPLTLRRYPCKVKREILPLPYVSPDTSEAEQTDDDDLTFFGSSIPIFDDRSLSYLSDSSDSSSIQIPAAVAHVSLSLGELEQWLESRSRSSSETLVAQELHYDPIPDHKEPEISTFRAYFLPFLLTIGSFIAEPFHHHPRTWRYPTPSFLKQKAKDIWWWLPKKSPWRIFSEIEGDLVLNRRLDAMRFPNAMDIPYDDIKAHAKGRYIYSWCDGYGSTFFAFGATAYYISFVHSQEAWAENGEVVIDYIQKASFVSYCTANLYFIATLGFTPFPLAHMATVFAWFYVERKWVVVSQHTGAFMAHLFTLKDDFLCVAWNHAETAQKVGLDVMSAGYGSAAFYISSIFGGSIKAAKFIMFPAGQGFGYLKKFLSLTVDIWENILCDNPTTEKTIGLTCIAAASSLTGYGDQFTAFLSGDLVNAYTGYDVPMLDSFALAFVEINRRRDTDSIINQSLHILARARSDQRINMKEWLPSIDRLRDVLNAIIKDEGLEEPKSEGAEVEVDEETGQFKFKSKERNQFTADLLERPLKSVGLAREGAKLMSLFFIDSAVARSWPAEKTRELVDSLPLPKLKKNSEIKLLYELTNILLLFKERVTRFHKTGDYNHLFKGEDVEKWTIDANLLIRGEDPDAEKPKQGWGTKVLLREDVWQERTARHLNEGKAFIDRTNHYHVASWSVWRELYEKYIQKICDQRSSVSREDPYICSLVGPPGIGKSAIQEAIGRLVAAEFGHLDPIVGSIKSMTKHYDGLNTLLNILLADDVDINHVDKVGMDTISLPGLILKVAGNTETNLPGAALQNKGKGNLKPDCMIISSNDKMYGAPGVVNCMGAVFRRIRDHFYCTLKPEIETNGLVDQEKLKRRCAELGVDNMLTMNIVVKRFRADEKDTDKKAPLFELTTISTFEELVAFVRVSVAEFRAETKAGRRVATRSRIFCPTCNLNVGLMSKICDHVTISDDENYDLVPAEKAFEEGIPVSEALTITSGERNTIVASFAVLYFLGPLSVAVFALSAALIYFANKGAEAAANVLLAIRATEMRTPAGQAATISVLSRLLPAWAVAKVQGAIIRRLFEERKPYFYALGAFTAVTVMWLKFRSAAEKPSSEGGVQAPSMVPKSNGPMGYTEPNSFVHRAVVEEEEPLPVGRRNAYYGVSIEALSPFDSKHKPGVHLKDAITHVATNMVRFTIRIDEEDDFRIGCAWRYAGNFFVFNSHYIPVGATATTTIRMKYTQPTVPGIKGIETLFLGHNLLVDREKDLAFCILADAGAPAGQGLERHMVANETMLPIKPDSAEIVVERKGYQHFPVKLEPLHRLIVGNFDFKKIWTYERQDETGAGDCGALAIITVQKHNFIGGHHCAGSGSVGHICALTRADIEPYFEALRDTGRCLVPESCSMFGPDEFSAGLYVHLSPGHPRHCGQHTGASGLFYGSCGPKTVPTFHTIHSPLAPYFQEFLDENQPPGGWQVPSGKGVLVDGIWYDPYVNMMRASRGEGGVNLHLLNHALMCYLGELRKADIRPGTRVLTFDEALVGVSGTDVHSVDLSTSMGPPFTEPKRHMIGFDDKKEEVFYLNNLETRFKAILSALSRREVVYPVSNAAIKDEKVTLAKREKVSLRRFEVLEAAHNLVGKALILPLLWIFTDNPLVTEAYFGIDLKTDQCDLLLGYMSVAGWRRIEADISKMDKNVKGDFAIAVGQVFEILAGHAGYSEEMAIAAGTYMVSVTGVYINSCGDFYFINGINTSGNSVTLLLNCVLLSLYFRYIFYNGLDMPPGSFAQYVHLGGVGDDSVQIVSPLVADKYNGELITRVADGFGTTMTDPQDKNLPPQWVDDEFPEICSRKARYSAELGRLVFPLKKERISAFFAIKGGTTLSEADHLHSILSNALREAVLWGRSTFDYVEERSKLALCELDLESRPLPNWEELLDWWRESYHVTPPKSEGLTIPGAWATPGFTFAPCVTGYRTYKLNSGGGGQSVIQGNSPSFTFFGSRRDTVDADVSSSNYFSVRRFRVPHQEHDHDVTRVGGIIWHSQPAEPSTIPQLPSSSADPHASGTLTTFDDLAVPTIQETSNPIISLRPNTLQDASLPDFLKRWTLIDTKTWVNTDSVGTEFSVYPWTLLLSNARVREKWRNYRRFSGKLHLRIVFDAPPTWFGHVIWGVRPTDLYAWNQVQALPTTDWPSITQLQHAHMLAAVSEPIELELPFIYSEPYFDLLDFDANAAARVYDLHHLEGVVISPLRSATSYVDAVSLKISIYARFSDYELSVPTQLEMLSSGAGHVADAAGNLAKIPILAGVMRPAQKIASTVADLAAYFGFTRTIDTKRNTVLLSGQPNLVAVDGEDNCITLAYNQGSGVALDPGSAGAAQQDELAFASLFPRPTHMKQVLWTTTDQAGDVLQRFPVHPAAYSSNAGSEPFQHSVVGYFARWFSRWAGTMKYTLRAHGSALHRGRLQIIYVPDDTQHAADPTNTTYNAFYDISSDKAVEFCVGWASNKWALGLSFNDFATDVGLSNCNGYIEIRVANALVAPDPDASVYVEFYLSAEPDMRFFGFRAPGISRGGVALESGIAGATSMGDIPCYDLVSSDGTLSKRTEVIYGDAVQSARTLCQKPFVVGAVRWYRNGGALTLGSNDPEYVLVAPGEAFPFAPRNGAHNGQWCMAAGSNCAPITVVENPLGAVAACFLGYRGSLSYRLSPQRQCTYTSAATAGVGQIRTDKIYVGLTSPDTPIVAKTYEFFPTSGVLSDKQTFSNLFGLGQVFNNYVNNAASWRVPFYFPRSYRSYRAPQGRLLNADTETPIGLGFALGASVQNEGADSTVLAVQLGDLWVSGGPDFNPVHFRGIPTMNTTYSAGALV